MDNYNFTQQGWQCPICKRVYSPFIPCCCICGAEDMTKTSTELHKDLEKDEKEFEFYKRRYFEFVDDLENFLNQYNLIIDSTRGCYKPLSLYIQIEERSDEE